MFEFLKNNLKYIILVISAISGIIGAGLTIDARYVTGKEYNIEKEQMNQKILRNRVDLLWSQYSALSQIHKNNSNKKLIEDRLKRIEIEINTVQSQIR